MASRSPFIAHDLTDYLLATADPPDDLQRELTTRTVADTDAAVMQIGHDQATFMSSLVALLQPKTVIEIGTFTGYSALAMARSLPAEGRLICCDISDEWTSIAREFWERDGVADRIDLRIGPALETLRSLPPDASVDMAFIDADKTGYLDYYEELVPRLSSRGLILVDNVLWSGAVVDESVKDESTVALRAFNQHVVDDPRTSVVIVPIGDGVSFIRLADG